MPIYPFDPYEEVLSERDELYHDKNNNGRWDEGESFIDENNNGIKILSILQKYINIIIY